MSDTIDKDILEQIQYLSHLSRKKKIVFKYDRAV